jgi:rubrerythrin
VATESRIKTPEEILQIALRKERASFEFYSNLLDRSGSVEVVRNLLEQLKTEEHKHIHMIEKKLIDFSRA